MANEPNLVQALHAFSGTNNDELCFKKGDVITITQQDEGWWEGTLGGTTGWFPSNYVREIKEAPQITGGVRTSETDRREYQAIVLKDMIDSEQAHVSELQGLVNNFLHPLEKSTILTDDEFKQLTSNINEILEMHIELLKAIENEQTKLYREQKVGRLFMNWALQIKTVHQNYCSQHPRAVCILDKYKDDLTRYMESLGATTPGILVLTTGLSKPFRRLDKYSGMLLELERHVDEGHPDRGDTQRSVAVYKEIATTCAAIRRQKELELQVLTGPVRGWEGQSLVSLGDIIYMGSVAIGPQHLDRYLVLFPSTLLMLSVSHRLSAFIYEGKLPLTGISVVRLEDTEQYKNAFEINGPMIEKVTAVCQSRDEANHWVDILRKHNSTVGNINRPSMSNVSQKILPSQPEIIPQPPPHMTAVLRNTPPPHPSNSTAAINAPPALQSSSSTISTSHSHPHLSSLYQQQQHRPDSTLRNRVTISTASGGASKPGWSLHCLRVAPPWQPCTALANGANGAVVRYSNAHKSSGGGGASYKDDAMILEVIEAYCNIAAARTRNTANSVDSQSYDGNKNLDSGKYSQERMDVLQQKLRTIESVLIQERLARCTLQQILKNYMKNNAIDTDKIEWPSIENKAYF